MLRMLSFAFLLLLALPALAVAAENVPSVNNEQALSAIQVYALLIGSVTPLVGYVLNTYAPWASEPVKAFVQVALAAAAGVLLQLLDAGDLAWDTETLQVVGTAVIGALAAHKALWLPAGVSAALGGGQNRNAGGEGGYSIAEALLVCFLALLCLVVIVHLL